MASRLFLKRSQRLVAFWPSLRALRPALHTAAVRGSTPKDVDSSKLKLPLPGNVGFCSQLPFVSKVNKELPDVLTGMTNQENTTLSLVNAAQYQKLVDDLVLQSKCEENLECVIQECPMLMKKDIQVLFPRQESLQKSCTVITFCQKTKNDMSVWSADVEEEREELMEDFFWLASSIRNELEEMGHFADFIDPGSGTPHFMEDVCTTTLFETDERYRHLGFEIEDLGCCKVINHRLWGTRVFLGTIFTDASLQNPVIQKLLRVFKNDK